MAKLPSAADFNEGLPQTRGANSVQAVQVQPDLATGRMLEGVGELVYKESQKLDGLQAEEALSKIRQARLDLTMGEQGAYSVKGGSVLDPKYASGYKSQLETTTAGIMANLSPGAQARLKPHADRELTGLQSDVLRHSMTEAEKYHTMVREGSAATIQNIGMAQWGDPIAFQAQLAELDKIAMSDASKMGLTGATEEEKNTLTALRQKRMSPMFVGGITAALDSRTPAGVARAEELFKQGGLVIDANARLQLGEHISKAKDGLAVQASAGGIVAQVAQSNAPTERLNVAAMTTAVNVTESGAPAGNHYTKTGALILGPVIPDGMHKGDRAVGKFQIMPKVAPQDAKEAGLAWDEKLFYSATPEGEKYHEALQKAHVARIMKNVSTPEQFFAAYVGGENGVAAAVKKYEKYAASGLEKAGVPPPVLNPDGSQYVLNPARPVSFIDFMAKPDMVRDYVKKASKTYAALPDVIQPSSAELRSQLEKQHPGRPDLVASGMAIVEKRLKEADEQVKQGIDVAVAQAYKYMDMNQTFEDIPQSLLAKLPAKEQDTLRKAMIEHQTGTPRDSNQQVLALLNTDPQYAARMPAGEWAKLRPQLSETAWKFHDKQRTAIRDGDTKSAEALNSGAVNTALKGVMFNLGFNPNPRKTDAVEIARFNTARSLLDQAVLEEQARLNRQLTDVEVMKLLSDKLKTQEDIKHFFAADEKKPVLTMAYSDIPSKVRNEIYDDLKKKTGTPPTDAQVLLTYKQWKTRVASAPPKAEERYIPVVSAL